MENSTQQIESFGVFHNSANEGWNYLLHLHAVATRLHSFVIK